MTSHTTNCNGLSLDVIHAQLGHSSPSNMNHISFCHNKVDKQYFCGTCIMAKSHRLPFNKSSISTSFPFQLIHMDVWGPYRVANVTGARLFLTIVDDFTRSTWTQLLHNKTQVAPAVQHFFAMIETQFQAKITLVRSDNGTEFLNSICHDFFLTKGIVHQTSIVKTPQ